MSTYTFDPKDWPLKAENGHPAQYQPDISKPPLKRGVLHGSSQDRPLIPWHELDRKTVITGTTLNHVSYHVSPQIDTAKIVKVRTALEHVFSLAFPGKEVAGVSVWNGPSYGKEGCYVSFTTPCDNVSASDIVTIAHIFDWKADNRPLGVPWYVGFQTTTAQHPVKFLDVPQACKNDFIDSLPQFLTQDFDRNHAIEVHDIWEQQSRTDAASPWKFNGEVLVLVSICCAVPTSNQLITIANKWPGWYHFADEHMIKLEYPSRFDYCTKCKHTAQDLSGPNERHKAEACIRIICGVCGHRGHDSATGTPDPTGSYKRACEEGKKRRQKEREEKEEVRKRQKLAEEEEAKKKADEEEARRKAEEEEARRKAEKEEAQKKAEEEEGRKKEEEARKKAEEEEARKKAEEDAAEEGDNQSDVGSTDEAEEGDGERASKRLRKSISEEPSDSDEEAVDEATKSSDTVKSDAVVKTEGSS